MKKSLILLTMLFLLPILTGIVSAQSPEPTQTPYIIYVVVTATPEPEPNADESQQIRRSSAPEEISLVNNGGTNEVAITNQAVTTNDYALTTDELVSRVVATVMAQAGTAAGGTDGTIQNNTGSAGGVIVRNSDGTNCTMNFELVGEPTFPAGSIIPRGAVFWKEWMIRNTGTCTWTNAWSFVFDSGWQIGNTRFSMNRTTAPGETLTVRLAMVPDQPQNGNYYSTYAFEAPDGTKYGTITSSYTVKDQSYFDPKPTIPPEKRKPQHGHPAGPIPPCPPYPGWWCPPHW